MFQKDYTYEVARIRCKELSLFSASMMEQLIACKTYDEALRFLADKGWGGSEDYADAEALLAAEKKKTWELIGEMVEDMSVFDVMRIPDDFHNLKAAIKLIYTNSTLPPERLFLNGGRLDAQELLAHVRAKEFDALPGRMATAGQEAYNVLTQTGDGQLCDIILDRAALEDMLAAGKASRNEVLREYALRTAVAANIKIAVRSGQTGKSLDFVRRALAPCPTLNTDALAHAAVAGFEAVVEYLAQSEYQDAAAALQESPAAFERWCDNLIIRYLQPQKANPFTVGPLAAFILARENEIKCARVVLSGKLNNLPESIIRERMREMYV